MHVEDYINTVGKQHKNERQNFEFNSISTLREFIERAIKNCTIHDVIKSVCDCPKKDDCAGYGAVGERACNACQENKQTVL